MQAHQKELSQWISTVSTHMPHLSKPEATVLALYSFGMIIAQSCGLTSIAVVLALLCHQSENTIRQRLREFYQNKGDKRGTKRKEVLVESCFAPLLRWVVTWWNPDERRLVLAMDATTLRDTFTVLSIHVVYRGCAIPIAWVVVEATRKGAWQPHWRHLFNCLREVIPADWTVLVLADRGLYAKWLFKKIRDLDWHPFLRIKHQYAVRPHGLVQWRPITELIAPGAAVWCGTVTCFRTPEAQITGTLLLSWASDATEPWAILTDLSPDTAEIAWYGMRMWIEGSYKDMKRGGWHWEQTKMEEPARVARLWLVMAVATLWVLSVGGDADESLPASSLSDIVGDALDTPAPSRRSRPMSCFRRGVLRIRCALIMQESIPPGSFDPDPWPTGQPSRSRSPRAPTPLADTSRVLWIMLIALLQAQNPPEPDGGNT